MASSSSSTRPTFTFEPGEEIAEGIASTIFADYLIQGENETLVARKEGSISTLRGRTPPEPHDILKEVHLLRSFSHPNVRLRSYRNCDSN